MDRGAWQASYSSWVTESDMTETITLTFTVCRVTIKDIYVCNKNIKTSQRVVCD